MALRPCEAHAGDERHTGSPPVIYRATCVGMMTWQYGCGAAPGAVVVVRRRFGAPHHTISPAGPVGGGVGWARPGELTLAHRGVLFLDELSEFGHRVPMRYP